MAVLPLGAAAGAEQVIPTGGGADTDFSSLRSTRVSAFSETVCVNVTYADAVT